MTNQKASRFLLILLSFIISFTLIACSDTNYPKAEESVKGFFDAMNKTDFKTAESYCAISSSEIFQFTDQKEEKFAKLIFSTTKYEIISSKVEDDKTIVKVKLTYVDLTNAFSTVMEKVFEAAFNGEDMSDEKSEEMIMKFLEESMTKPDATVKTKEMDITLNKDRKKKMWLIQNDSEFIKGVTGGLLEMLNM